MYLKRHTLRKLPGIKHSFIQFTLIHDATTQDWPGHIPFNIKKKNNSFQIPDSTQRLVTAVQNKLI